MNCKACLAVALLALTSIPTPAAVMINELMASNVRAYPDITDFEDYPDWIELKNDSPVTASLSGYYLSDDPTNPFKWALPSGASIPANGFVLIMADGHDAGPGQTFPRGYWPWKDFVTEKYHANFSLSKDGETLTLTRATGVSTVALVNASRPMPVPPASVAIWKYLDNGSNQGTSWRARNFDDASWAQGPAELGYGDTQATSVSYGPSSSSKYITTYFRHHFTVANPAAMDSLSLKLLVDDGCVVYLNGTEVVRRNMPEGEITHTTRASVTVGGSDESTFFSYTLPSSSLVAGDNVLAVEVHQASSSSSDISFDLGLTGSAHTGSSQIDTVTYPRQVADVSYGRDQANPAVWKQFAEATPGSDNNTLTEIGTVTLVNASSPPPVPPASVAIWKYLDNGSNQGTPWRARTFNDAGWAQGPAELGYGDTQVTRVSYGPSSSSKYITTYFRHHFTVADPAALDELTLRLLVDDGCIVYLNGAEVVRRNMPAGTVTYTTRASRTVGGSDESTFFNYSLPTSGLVAGNNVLAVEVHQASSSSSDISFDLGLSATTHTSSGTVDTVDDLRAQSSDVTVSLPGGLYASSQTVVLSSAGGDIRYTLDGSNPRSTSTLYTGPLHISGTTVLRARCFETGKVPGPIVTRTYLFGETLANVPYVSLVADPETLFGDTIGIYHNQHESVSGSYGEHDAYKGKDAPANLEFFPPGGVPGFSVNCSIRIGGENNWVHPQKALNIALRKKYGDDSLAYDLFPGTHIGVHSAFGLRDGGDNWGRAMLRDAIFGKLAPGYLNVDSADYRPTIVFINGVYYGIYNLRQRWDETWFAQKYHVKPGDLDHLEYGHLTSPSTTLGADEGSTKNWLELLDFLNTNNLSIPANWAYVESKMDIDSLMDWAITESYANNGSWHHDREFWREKGAGHRWRWFITDLDRSFQDSSLTGLLSSMLSTDEALRRLRTNTAFKQRLAQRYAAHMAGTFLPSRIQAIVSQMDLEVRALVPRHAARWAPDGMTVSGRSSNIQEIKNYANLRASNVYGELSSVLGVGSTVTLTLAPNNRAQGRFRVQGVPVDAASFRMFANIPFTLEAMAAPGYVFSHWIGATGGSNTTVTLGSSTTITAVFVPSGETVIGGTLSGNTTLTTANSPYALNADLIVRAGVTLTVQPGVELLLSDHQNIRVQGVLNIEGTDAQPVTIHGRNGARWGGISFEAPAQPSHLAHLIIRNATKGYDPVQYTAAVSGHQATVIMDYLDIDDSEGPVFMDSGDCTLRDSILHNPFTGDGAHVKDGIATIQRCTFLGNHDPDTDAIDFDGVTNGLIEDCRIYRFRGDNSDGIDIGAGSTNILIQGNLIYFNADKGVSVGQGSSVTIRKNLVVGCAMGVGIKDSGSTALIDQNTFASCDIGVASFEKNFGHGGGAAVITDSIFYKVGTAPAFVDGYSTLSASYNLSDTRPLPGAFNFIADPAFVDPAVLNFELRTNSPAIDAGDPAHAPDPDSTRVDIGAAYLHQTNDYPFTIGETVVVNEILANSGGAGDWIELHNRTHAPVNIGGWFLSDSKTEPQKYRIPFGTIIPADGYLVFYETNTFGLGSVDTNKIAGFALRDDGETIHLLSAVNDQLTDYESQESFGPSLEGTTLGFYYKSSSDSYNFVPLTSPTPGAPNSAPQVGPIVITEIMYHPPGAVDAEYFELLNISNAPVTLYDPVKGPWRITDGVDFDFPTNAPLTMAPNERVVLTRNLTAFNAVYGTQVPPGVKVFEWTAGSLDNGGERLQLGRPGPLDASNVVQYVRVDRVNYDDDPPWPTTPDGSGPSLTKVLESEYGNDFANWMAATATPGHATAQSPLDSDGDGMPDSYEFANRLNPYDPNDAAQDADGDGQSNLDEYLAGTDPQDPNDSLRLSVTLTQGRALIQFNAYAGKTYTIQYKTALADPDWLTLSQVPAQGVTRPMSVVDSNITLPQKFYRVIIPQQP